MAEKDLPAARAATRPRSATRCLRLPCPRSRLGPWPTPTPRRLGSCCANRWRSLACSNTPSARPSPAVALARLLPLVVRLDPDRASSCLWLALARRPPLPARERAPVMPDARRRYLDLAELATLTSRYDRAAAEVVFAPVAARVAGLDDGSWGLGNEGPAIFRAAGTFDARAAQALLDGLPEDPTPPKRPPGVISPATSAIRARPRLGSPWPRSSACRRGSVSAPRSCPVGERIGSRISTTGGWIGSKGPDQYMALMLKLK